MNPPQNDQVSLIALFNSDKYLEAIHAAEILLKTFSKSDFLWNLIATSKVAIGDFNGAVIGYENSLKINPNFHEGYFNLGVALQKHGKLSEAVSAYKKATKIKPDYLEANYNLGAALQAIGNLDEAINYYQIAIKIRPDYLEANYNLATVLQAKGKIDEAITYYQHTIDIKPDYVEANYNLATIYQAKQMLSKAIKHYQDALKVRPNYFEATYNLAAAFRATGKLEETIQCYQNVLDAKPDHAETRYNMGTAFQEKGELNKAIDYYQNALRIQPDFAEAHHNLATVLKDQGKLESAVASYQDSIKIKPDYAEAYNNLAIVLTKQGKLERAISCYQKALKIKPRYPEALYNLGLALKEQGNRYEAIINYKRAVELEPTFIKAKINMLFEQQHLCDFSVYSEIEALKQTKNTKFVAPFIHLSWVDSAAQQLEQSQNYAQQTYGSLSTPLPARPIKRPERLKIGYFSSDFYDHATLYLLSGVLRSHDTTQFEIHAYSYGLQKSGVRRKSTEAEVEFFHDIADLSDQEILQITRSHKLDIAIDLKGYTGGTKSGLFQHRLAPIQINYLGYPGSLGASFIDYLIADPVVIPKNFRDFYSEKIIYLPHCYQPTDDAREIANITTERADFNLPDEGFVYCCFNSSYKISPKEFDIWMRLLTKVEDSVLWLLARNEWVINNLRHEAQVRGIDPSRLIFAPALPQKEHLARQKHADLFLDTFHVNAHTTSSDALWVGLPVLTKAGNQFAARVASSTLMGVGLPELITHTETDYENRAIELAKDPNKLEEIRNKLVKNINCQPLFDTKKYTEFLESGFKKVYGHYFTGKEPTDVWVNT